MTTPPTDTGRQTKGVPIFWLALAVLGLVLAILNVRQQPYWANNLLLFAHASQIAPHNKRALAIEDHELLCAGAPKLEASTLKLGTPRKQLRP